MKTSIFKTIALALLIIILSGAFYTISAQQPRKALERIGQMKKSKLLEILDLSEESSNKFLSKYTAWEKKVLEQKKAIDEASADLESSLRKGDGKDVLIQKSQKLIEAQVKLQNLNTEKLKAMKEVLNDVEYAKFLVFEDRFPKELQRMILKKQKGLMRPGKEKPE